MPAPLCPGGPYFGAFPTPVVPGMIAVSDTFTATATAVRNGVSDPSFVLTVTQPSPGYWSVSGTIPTSYVAGDTLAIFATVIDTTLSPTVATPVLVDVILVADPKAAALVALAEAKADARKLVLQAMEAVE